MIDQIFIAIFGATAVFLSQSKHHSQRKLAPLFGLAGQPFWFYSAWVAGQWGIFALCVLYLFCWLMGLWNFWISPYLVERNNRL